MKVSSRVAATVGLIVLAQFSVVEPSQASDLLRALTEGAAAAGGASRIEAPLDGGPATVSYYTEVPCATGAGAPAAHRIAHRRRVHRRPHALIAHPIVAAPPKVKPKPAPKPAARVVAHARPRPHHRRRPHPPIAVAAPAPPTRCLALHSSQLLRPTALLETDLLPQVNEPDVDVRPYVAPPLLVDTPPTLGAPMPWINPWSWLPPTGYPGGPGVKGAPEPATWVLMLTGVGAIGAALRRRRRRIAPG